MNMGNTIIQVYHNDMSHLVYRGENSCFGLFNVSENYLILNTLGTIVTKLLPRYSRFTQIRNPIV